MTLLRMRHVTEYAYAARVELAAHMLHMRPRVLPWQSVRDYRLDVWPVPDRVQAGLDHFGNPVAWVFLDRAHERLTVTAEAVVDVQPQTAPHPADSPPWEAVAACALQAQAARTVAEFTFGSAMAPTDAAARAFTAASFTPGRPVLEALLELMGRIWRDFRFDPEVTTISTPVARVMQLRAGVCQDFAHLMIAGLRGLGLPARYVSGYLRTRPPPGQARLQGADQSHAWVGCWMGPALGWIDLDPTNDLVVADQHVWLGWGRDYADVSPIRGMLLGGGRHTMRVGVDIEPVGEPVSG